MLAIFGYSTRLNSPRLTGNEQESVLKMKLGVALPVIDAEVGGDPGAIRDFAQAAEEIGYCDLSAPDHMLGVNAASRPGWDRNTSADLFQDPFVLFGFLAGCTRAIGFSTQVLILAQRQAVLVAKQAACLDVLCGGRFRLGIGVGWNEVEFVGLNESFRDRGRRSEEQVAVMKAVGRTPRHFQGEISRDRGCGDQSVAPQAFDSHLAGRSRGRHAAPGRQLGRWLDAAQLWTGR